MHCIHTHINHWPPNSENSTNFLALLYSIIAISKYGNFFCAAIRVISIKVVENFWLAIYTKQYDVFFFYYHLFYLSPILLYPIFFYVFGAHSRYLMICTFETCGILSHTHIYTYIRCIYNEWICSNMYNTYSNIHTYSVSLHHFCLSYIHHKTTTIQINSDIRKARAPSPPSMKSSSSTASTNDKFYLQLTQDDKYYSNESSYCWKRFRFSNIIATKQTKQTT